MTKHQFHMQAQWPGGRNGIGKIQCGQLETTVSIDARMDGPGVGTNPDEMLLSAAGTCYFMTLAALIERRQLAVETMSFESDMTVGTRGSGFTCEKIVHRPHVTLASTATVEDMRILERLVTAADRACMISNALQGNVEIVLEPVLDRATG